MIWCQKSREVQLGRGKKVGSGEWGKGQPDLRGKIRDQSITHGLGKAGFNEARERGKWLKYDQRQKACQVKAKSRVKQIRNIHPRIHFPFSMGGLFPVLLSALPQAVVNDEATQRKQCLQNLSIVPLFPAKQFLHDMGQRVIGTLPSRPPWTSHGRSCPGKIHDLEQIMIMMIMILAIMEDRTYKTLNILRCWWFILWESGIDSEDSASGHLAMNSKTYFNNLKYMSPIKWYQDYSKWNNNNDDDDDVDGNCYNLKVNCLK